MINATNCIYNKILDHDWFSAHPFLTSSVSNYRCPIWTFVIGYPPDLHVNYARFKGFFAMFMKTATDVFAQNNFPKDIFNSKICYRYD